MVVNPFLTAISLMAGLSVAMPPAMSHLVRRDPSDTSGNSVIAFKCEAVTVPNQGGAGGAGEGGSGLFSSNLRFQPPNGADAIAPTNCEADSRYPKNGNCQQCTMSGGGLSEDVLVHSCFVPQGGECSIVFDYHGKHYDSEAKQPQCGHTSKGFIPFSSSEQAICYFDE